MVRGVIRTVVALVIVSCSGDVVTPRDSDETIYCNGAVDCPEHPECAAFWCQQIQKEDDDYGVAWGRCNLAPAVGGAPCDGGAGICVNRECRPAR